MLANFTNPYPDLTSENCQDNGGVRLAQYVPKEDQKILRIAGGLEESFIRTAMTIFFHHLVTVCKNNNWTTIDANEQLKQYVCRLCQTTNGNDRRGTGPMGNTAAPATNKHATSSGVKTQTVKQGKK